MSKNNSTSFTKKYGNAITIGLWVVALSSHAILIPKFLREVTGKKGKA